MKLIRLRYLALFALWLAAAGSSSADEPQVHGFITQGWFKTDSNNYFGPSSRAAGSWEFDEFGINPSWKPNDHVRYSALFLMRQAGGTDNNSLRVDHAIADITLDRATNSTSGVLLGRIKTPFGFYGETRDVAETRPSILLPQSLYFDQARKYVINADGAQLYWNRWGDDSSNTHVAFEIAHQNGIDNPETETTFLGADFPGQLRQGPSYGLHVTHDRNGGRTKFALFVTTTPKGVEYTPAPVDVLQAGTMRIDSLWLSFHQELGQRWGITSELFLPRFKYSGFGPFIPDKTTYPQGYYVELQFRPAPKWETFVRRDIAYLDRSDKSGERLSAVSGRPAYSFFAKDSTVGARYHITPKLSLSAEWHSVDGTEWLPVQDNPNYSATSRYWNLFATQLSYTW